MTKLIYKVAVIITLLFIQNAVIADTNFINHKKHQPQIENHDMQLFNFEHIIPGVGNHSNIPNNQNFQLNVETIADNKLNVTVDIKPGNYIYLDHFKFKVISSNNILIKEIHYPENYQIKEDPFYGQVKIYKNHVTIPISFNSPAQQKNLQLLIEYQGCSEQGICYAPESKIFSIDLNNIGQVYKGENPSKYDHNVNSDTDGYAHYLMNTNIILLLLIFLGIGMLLSFTPCVLPLIPILSGIITGQKELSTGKAFRISLSYIIGMASSYAIMGTIAGVVGGGVQNILQTPIAIIMMALLFLIMSGAMFGLFEIRMPSFILNKVNTLSSNQKSGTYIGTFIMGILSTLVVSTCVTAPLVAVLTYISYSGNAITGGLLLFAMGLGMGIPLLIFGTTSGSLLPKSGKWMNSIKYFSGILLIGMAIYMLSKLIPMLITFMLLALFLITLAIVWGKFNLKHTGIWARTQVAFSYLMLLYGSTLFVGVLMGNASFTHPIMLAQNNDNIEQLKFNQVTNVKQLDQQLKLAKSESKPVLLDFYADWCMECQVMKNTTFKDQKLQQVLKGFHLIQADVTAVGLQSKELLSEFGLFGPPDIILYTPNGIQKEKIAGSVNAESLIQKLS